MQVSTLPTAKTTCSTFVPHLPLLAVPPQLDIVTCDAFLAACRCFLATRPRPQALRLDFAQTRDVDSCGIGALQQIVSLAREFDLPVVAWSVRPNVARRLIAAHLDREISMDARTRALDYPDRFLSAPHPERRPLHPSATSPFKRAIDILGALVGLSFTALLFLPIAIAIQLDNPGPVLFSQVRRGLLGRQVRIWKFRSMVVDAEARKGEVTNQIDGAFFKNDRDPRITRVGQFLRRTSLDELPQIWNVLRGDMSLVGPRPITWSELDRYGPHADAYLSLKPGVTGL
ncbi:MAG: sugar transferase, partial [Cyanobacteria bacterium J06639_1]